MSLFKANNLSSKVKKDKKHCILLVDDEIGNLNAISSLLESEYEIFTANDGAQALEIILDPKQTLDIDLVISDQRMPNMTGVELFERLVDILPNTKRIIITGYMDVDAIIDSVNKAHIYRLVLKPFDIHDFLLTVKRAIESFDMQVQLKAHQDNLELKVKQRTLELQATHEKLTHAFFQINQQAEELRELNKDKDKFLALLSHDLKGPLGNLHLMTDYLETEAESIDTENTAQIVHQINNMTLKVKKLLENILEWSRVHTGHIEFSPMPIEIFLLAQDASDLYQVQIEQHQINFINQINPDYVLNIDPNMVNAIFRNLISNAIKYTPDKGTIKVSLSCDEKSGTICIFNTGSYMAPNDINKLFKIDNKMSSPGQRGEQGTGLGLLLCKEYINKHQGEIWVTSEEEVGTNFFFNFPKNLNKA